MRRRDLMLALDFYLARLKARGSNNPDSGAFTVLLDGQLRR
jgi:hypothetical protein